MTISPSDKHIFCQRCGAMWDRTKTEKMREFTSSSFGRSTFASPKDIVDAGEDMIFCPKCFVEPRDKGLGDFSTYLKSSDLRVDPDGLDKERGSQGDADVSHTPKPL